jgi:hypothetical protein
MRRSKFVFTYKSQLTLNTVVNVSYAATYGRWSACQAVGEGRNPLFKVLLSMGGTWF